MQLFSQLQRKRDRYGQADWSIHKDSQEGMEKSFKNNPADSLPVGGRIWTLPPFASHLGLLPLGGEREKASGALARIFHTPGWRLINTGL